MLWNMNLMKDLHEADTEKRAVMDTDMNIAAAMMPPSDLENVAELFRALYNVEWSLQLGAPAAKLRGCMSFR